LSSNALFVLREERELISQQDYLNDYIMKNAQCHYTPQPEDEKKKVEEAQAEPSTLPLQYQSYKINSATRHNHFKGKSPINFPVKNKLR
jgi:hypothetical protein